MPAPAWIDAPARLDRIIAALDAGRAVPAEDAATLARALRAMIDGGRFETALGLVGNWRKRRRDAMRDETLRALAAAIAGTDTEKARALSRSAAISTRTIRRKLAKNSDGFGQQSAPRIS